MAGPEQPEIPGRPLPANVHHNGDLPPSPGGHLALPAHGVFAAEEVSLDVGVTAARAGLAGLIRGGLLGSVSAQAYNGGITGLARPGQPDSDRRVYEWTIRADAQLADGALARALRQPRAYQRAGPRRAISVGGACAVP